MKTIDLLKGCALIALGAAGVPLSYAQLPPVPVGATAVAQGLFGPRGLKVGPDGSLYVALSGPGGTNSVPEACQAADPSTNGVSAYTNGDTASIVRIDARGNVTTVANGFPSALSTHPDVEGVADVAFLNGQLYAVTAGGGCSHGTTVPQMVARVDQRTGTWIMIANMSQQLAAHPAAVVAGDFDPDGLFYSMFAWEGKLYAVEANHGQIWSITPGGQVQMVTDLSKAEGHVVPTTAVPSGEDLVVGNLGLFPITPDSSKLSLLAPNPVEGLIDSFDPWAPDQLKVVQTFSPGLTTVVSMAWGPDHALYLLELSSPRSGDAPPFFPTPGEGKVVRVKGHGIAEDVITGLSVPTGMTFGPDGALYVSNWGAADAPIGQILRFRIH